jgi:hypothetical protein
VMCRLRHRRRVDGLYYCHGAGGWS